MLSNGQITMENDMDVQNPKPNEFLLDSFEDLNFWNMENGSIARIENPNARVFPQPQIASTEVLNENMESSEDRRNFLEEHVSESSDLTSLACSDSQLVATILHTMPAIPHMLPQLTGRSCEPFQREGQSMQSTAYANLNALVFPQPKIALTQILSVNMGNLEDWRASKQESLLEGHDSLFPSKPPLTSRLIPIKPDPIPTHMTPSLPSKKWVLPRNFNHGSVHLVIFEGKPKFETRETEPPTKEKWKTKKRFKQQKKRDKDKRKSANKRDPRFIGFKGKKKKQKFANAADRINDQLHHLVADYADYPVHPDVAIWRPQRLHPGDVVRHSEGVRTRARAQPGRVPHPCTEMENQMVGNLHEPNEHLSDFYDGPVCWGIESSVAGILESPTFHDACAGSYLDMDFTFTSVFKESEEVRGQQTDQSTLSAPHLERHGCGSSYGIGVPTCFDPAATQPMSTISHPMPPMMPPLAPSQDTSFVNKSKDQGFCSVFLATQKLQDLSVSEASTSSANVAQGIGTPSVPVVQQASMFQPSQQPQPPQFQPPVQMFLPQFPAPFFPQPSNRFNGNNRNRPRRLWRFCFLF
ncbi:hypothetical protein RHSIM_Rhsim05G0023400 [Rhododendron simsii]|uniref:Uncharacterized protein n=1 Tax=Rhododendron simsii TaxID=118357 RepID=A0A834GYJ8_RHOSS|nr:hypothetical protein RHSIM_Rhsim05G0023400 [Rhododendron simsii]